MTQVVKTVMPIESFGTKIVNVVAMGDVNKPLDLGYISRLFKKVAYRPKRFPGLIFKPKNSQVSIMAFNSGKIVCSGARSVRQAKVAITGFVDRLRTNGLDFLDNPNVQAQNIVAHSDFKRAIDLEILENLRLLSGFSILFLFSLLFPLFIIVIKEKLFFKIRSLYFE